MPDEDERTGQPARPAPVGPVDAMAVPRFAGLATFARLPQLEEVERCDVAVIGVPPAYDDAELTSIAACHAAYELLAS